MVAGYANRGRLRLKVASVYASVPPKAAQTAPPSKRAGRAFVADAPWALSALPECFTPLAKSTGPNLPSVLAHLPAHMTMVRPPARLRYGDCTLVLSGARVLVLRGEDRLRIPPPTRIYTGAGILASLRAANGGYDLRTYSVKP